MAEIKGTHLTDDALELYSLQRLPESELDSFEEHLLICPACQDRLAESDSYVHTMQQALSRLQAEEAPAKVARQSTRGSWTAWMSWSPAWGMAMAAAVLLCKWAAAQSRAA